MSIQKRLLGKLLAALLFVSPFLAQCPQQSAAADGVGQALINTGTKYLGTPYQYGANPQQTASFDCSSFTQRVFRENGVLLPRTTATQYKLGTSVALADAATGDLVFFRDSADPGIPGHVGIFAGNGLILNATSSKGVKFTDMTTAYWQARFLGVQRVLPKQYAVKPGDTLWKIGAAVKAPIASIRSWNNLTGEMIFPGQMLWVENPDLTGQNKRVYFVQRGDTLWLIAQKYGVSVQSIVTANSLASPVIYPGQSLILPR